jgi:hypothetical protein
VAAGLRAGVNDAVAETLVSAVAQLEQGDVHGVVRLIERAPAEVAGGGKATARHVRQVGVALDER